jgi:hypothetical protein
MSYDRRTMMLKKTLLIALAAFGLAGSSAAQTDAAQAVVSDYTVFVDPPTGFAFVKLPQGWKFVGKVAEGDLAKLPGTVATALLKSTVSVAASGAGARLQD